MCDSSLSDFISGRYPGSMPDERSSLSQMAAGVDHIHTMDLVHRDIKPSNILISQNSGSQQTVQLKIADFGCCKSSEQGMFTISGQFGTWNYLAPEILHLLNEGEIKVPESIMSNACDVFALGCVFFEYLTKNHPFGNGVDVAGKIVSGTLSDSSGN